MHFKSLLGNGMAEKQELHQVLSWDRQKTDGPLMTAMTSGRPLTIYQKDLRHLEPSLNAKNLCFG